MSNEKPQGSEGGSGAPTSEGKLARMKTRASRAQTNLTGLMIGVLIAAIVAIQVFIPVVNDAISASNLSGTTETVVSLLPLFAGLLLLISLASPLMRRF